MAATGILFALNEFGVFFCELELPIAIDVDS